MRLIGLSLPHRRITPAELVPRPKSTSRSDPMTILGDIAYLGISRPTPQFTIARRWDQLNTCRNL